MGRKKKLKKRNPKGNGNLSLSVFFKKTKGKGGQVWVEGLEAKTTGENISTKKPTPPLRPTYIESQPLDFL